MPIIHLTEETYQTEVAQSTIPVLIDFYATWCGPCKMLAPILEQVAKERPDIKVCKVDVDQEPGLANAFSVQSIPTLFVVKENQVVKQAVGYLSKEELLSLL